MRSTVPFLAAAAIVLAGCQPRDDVCSPGQVLCGGCIDPARYQTDPVNCGVCGLRCPTGAACVAGHCACSLGQTACGGACTDLMTDSFHCGSCSEFCNLGTCSSGACVCAANATQCTGPGTQCVDLATDVGNCGACRAACPLNEACQTGACVCVAPREICTGACVDPATDPFNCGRCGSACATGGVCTSGVCGCPPSEFLCGSSCIRCDGGQCIAGACSCATGPSSGCGGSCCTGGDQCCSSKCPTAHSNGLGGTFFDCHTTTYAPNQTTATAAREAADSWKAGSTSFITCDISCLTRQAGGQCATWCYGTSKFAGHVSLNSSSTQCLCPTDQSPIWQ